MGHRPSFSMSHGATFRENVLLPFWNPRNFLARPIEPATSRREPVASPWTPWPGRRVAQAARCSQTPSWAFPGRNAPLL
jgi:hypothetical protein